MRKARAAGRKGARGKASKAKKPARKPARGAKGPKAAARKPAAAKGAPRPAAAPAGGAGRVKELETELARWQTLHGQVQEQLRQRDSAIAFKEKEILDLRKKVEELTQAQGGKGPAG